MRSTGLSSFCVPRGSLKFIVSLRARRPRCLSGSMYEWFTNAARTGGRDIPAVFCFCRFLPLQHSLSIFLFGYLESRRARSRRPQDGGGTGRNRRKCALNGNLRKQMTRKANAEKENPPSRRRLSFAEKSLQEFQVFGLRRKTKIQRMIPWQNIATGSPVRGDLRVRWLCAFRVLRGR